MDPSSDSSHTTLHATDTESVEGLTPSQRENADNVPMEVCEEEKPTCSGECQMAKKRFTVKKWNAVAMWAWGKPKPGLLQLSLGPGRSLSSSKAD